MKTILLSLLLFMAFHTQAQTAVYAKGRVTFCFWGGSPRLHAKLMKRMIIDDSIKSLMVATAPTIITLSNGDDFSCCGVRFIAAVVCRKRCLTQSELEALKMKSPQPSCSYSP
jgi:hypothetical protein